MARVIRRSVVRVRRSKTAVGEKSGSVANPIIEQSAVAGDKRITFTRMK